MRLGISFMAAAAWLTLVPVEAKAQFSKCGNDALTPQEATARVEWARRCALNKLSPSQGFDVSGGGSPMYEYQEADPATNGYGQNAYHGDIMNFEVNATYAHALFGGIASTQVVDEYGFYKWTSNDRRQFPYHPMFGSTPFPGNSDHVPLYPHPTLADCNLYTDRSGYNLASTFYVNMYCTSTYTTLANGTALTGQSGAAGSERYYTVNIPEGSTSLSIWMSGGSGNADLYVKHGSSPTTASYNCGSAYGGNYDSCYISTPTPGTYYVMLKGATSYASLSLMASWNELQQGVAVSNLYAGWAVEKLYTFYAPGNLQSLSFDIYGGTGDADIYVRYGAPPTLSTYDCRPYTGGNAEKCSYSYPSGGVYYVMIRAYSRYSGVSLIANYTEVPDPCYNDPYCCYPQPYSETPNRYPVCPVY